VSTLRVWFRPDRLLGCASVLGRTKQGLGA
jgi:hypothetical protein